MKAGAAANGNEVFPDATLINGSKVEFGAKRPPLNIDIGLITNKPVPSLIVVMGT